MNYLTTKLKNEFESFATDKVKEGTLTLENRDEWHFYLFNEDYYIIGYYETGQWLKGHNIGELEGANICIQYEKDNFGECHKEYDNTETVANMLVYIFGEEWIYSEGEAFIEGLLDEKDKVK